MKLLLSTLGSRGAVQPLIALALELRALGHAARLCVPPDFSAWIESYQLECIPIGPSLRAPNPAAFSAEQPRQPDDQFARDQFRVLRTAAEGCDLLLTAHAPQIAARSVAEELKIPYVYAAYCPAVLPSTKYPPPKADGAHPQSLPAAVNKMLWAENEASFAGRFGGVLNEERARAGLPPLKSLYDHLFSARPWLAADPELAPAFPIPGMEIVQTGAWLLPDSRALPEELERFLSAGAPPLFFSFGGLDAGDRTAAVLLEAARALGLRSLFAGGWAEPAPVDAGEDCFTVGDVNFDALFPRLAGVVHSGGAGTTTAAARAGRPQVVIPLGYDQFYWANRVQQARIGAAGPAREALSAETLVRALRGALTPEVEQRAQALAGRMWPLGARIAALELERCF